MEAYVNRVSRARFSLDGPDGRTWGLGLANSADEPLRPPEIPNRLP